VGPECGGGSGLPERTKEHAVGRVLDDASGCTHPAGNLADLRIERVHDHTNLGQPIANDCGDRKTVRSGKDLVDNEDLREKLSAQLDALPTVLCDANALHVRFGIDQVAKVLANRGMVLRDEHSHSGHAEDYRSDKPPDKAPFGHA
jgi:hypothetical protein